MGKKQEIDCGLHSIEKKHEPFTENTVNVLDLKSSSIQLIVFFRFEKTRPLIFSIVLYFFHLRCPTPVVFATVTFCQFLLFFQELKGAEPKRLCNERHNMSGSANKLKI